jgi:hypothetical protein
LLHLEWSAAEPAEARAPDADAAPGLGPEQFDKLRELAAIGYVSGLRTQLAVFERETPAAAAAIAELRALLAEYRIDAFLAALDAASAARPALRDVA